MISRIWSKLAKSLSIKSTINPVTKTIIRTKAVELLENQSITEVTCPDLWTWWPGPPTSWATASQGNNRTSRQAPSIKRIKSVSNHSRKHLKLQDQAHHSLTTLTASSKSAHDCRETPKLNLKVTWSKEVPWRTPHEVMPAHSTRGVQCMIRARMSTQREIKVQWGMKLRGSITQRYIPILR